MKRLRRLLLVLASTIAVLGVAAAVVYLAFREPIARLAVERALRSAGLSGSTFDLRSVSLEEIELANVELRGAGTGAIDSLRATYSLGSLLKGRVHALEIGKAQVVFAEDSQAAADDRDALQRLRPRFDLPLDRISLREATVTIPSEGGLLRLALDGEINRVSPNGFHTDLGISFGDNFVFSSGDVQIGGLLMQAHLAVRAGQRETVISLREGSVITVDRVSIAGEALTLASPGVRLNLRQIDGEPLMRIGRSGGGPMIRAAAEVFSTAAITLEIRGGRMFIPGASATAHYTQTASDEPVVRMDVSVESASLRLPELNMAVGGVNATIPVDFNVPVARRGPVAIEAVVFRGVEFNGFTGGAGVAEGYFDADIEGALGGGAQLAINAAVDFTHGVSADIAGFIPRFQLTDAAVIRRIVPELREAQMGGIYTADAQILMRDGQIDPFVHINAINASMFNTGWPLAIDSADADVTFTSLSPLRTPPDQRIAIHRGRVGQIEVDGGEIGFEVHDRAGVKVDDVRWSMGPYGRFRGSPFAFQLLEPVFQTSIGADDVGLGAWLELLTSGRATSDGLLRGVLDLHVDSRLRQPLRIMGGQLQSQLPAGNVDVEDARMLGRFLDRNIGNENADEQWQTIRTRLVDALTAYRYDMLQVDFIPEGDDVLCRVRTSGRGRFGAEAQEIGSLTVNVRNFNDVLNEVLMFRSAFTGRE